MSVAIACMHDEDCQRVIENLYNVANKMLPYHCVINPQHLKLALSLA